jgi:hypothetical protein
MEDSKIGIAYVIITTVLFLFPPELPVTGSNMSKSSLFAYMFFDLSSRCRRVILLPAPYRCIT